MHQEFMYRCLELAAKAQKDVGNGALVGAVLVRKGNIIAEAYHKKYGDSHAELELLKKSDLKIESNDVLYVNLEPCCHTGKTPPCTDIILKKGIKHVVYGMKDPDPRVSGQGIELLRKNGVEVIGPVLRAECEWVNRGFTTVRTKNRPWITLKSARTKDGRIAGDDGSRLSITSEEQNIWSHTFLRTSHDGIVVGVQTVINDSVQLNARLDGLKRNYHPWRIILDPTLRIPVGATVLTDSQASNTIVITRPENMVRAEHICQKGAKVFAVPYLQHHFDWNALWSVLLTPDTSFHGVTSLLVEGGEKTWGIFKNAEMVDMEVCLRGN